MGINGFGRIGRCAARIALENPQLELAAINSRANVTSHAYLLKHDTIYGDFSHRVTSQGSSLIVDKSEIAVYQQHDPASIPWKKHKVDIVLETTGVFKSLATAGRHLSSGVKKVIISAPPKDNMPTFCFGVNHRQYDPEKMHVINNASCTTNCLAAVAKVLEDSFGIQKGFMTTTHAYTDSQNLLDNSHKKDLRLTRSAPNNLIPSSTGASESLGKVIPSLSGRIISSSLRIPQSSISLIDLVILINKKASAENINTAYKLVATTSLKNVLAYSEEPLVSSDIKNSSLKSYSAVIDGLLTQANGNLINIKAWYDNEWGYASRLIDMALYIAKFL